MRFFGYLWRFIERLVKAVQVLFFLFIVVFVIGVFSGLSGVAVSVPDKAALVIAPDGALVEQASGESLNQALLSAQGAEAETVVHDVVESLRRAADDNRISAVVLLPDTLTGGGLNKLQMVGAAIDEFKKSGKPVIAMADSYDQFKYYFASRADEVYMHDFGVVLIEGFGYFKTYFAAAINKLNVDVNVFRVGEFKSFVEPYLRNDMSAEDKQNASRWLERLWTAYKNDVSTARGLSTDDFDNYVNNAAKVLEAADGNAAQAAIDGGLIDGLKSRNEFRDYMASLVGVDNDAGDSYSHIDYQSYLMATDFAVREQQQSDKNVAVIVASGEIVDGEAPAGTIGGDSLARLIRRAAMDDDIGAVVLRVDSPGGSMFASEVVYDELQALRARGKPLVASMGALAASGGYYISMGADEIWARDTTISGSIGVGAIFPTFQRALDTLGVTIDGFGTGQLAGQMNPMMELGPEGRRVMDISIKSAYDVFISKVAENRHMDKSAVDEIARGQVWIGADAFELGLVDKIGGLDDALDSAARLAGFPDDGWGVVYVQEEPSLGEKLLAQYLQLLQKAFSLAGYGNPGVNFLQKLAAKVAAELPALQGWNDPRGIYYHCLCELK